MALTDDETERRERKMAELADAMGKKDQEIDTVIARITAAMDGNRPDEMGELKAKLKQLNAEREALASQVMQLTGSK